MKKITKIAENKQSSNEQKKLRVAAYCRVSTDSDAQLESLEAQKTHYENYINSRKAWEFAGLYYDDYVIIGISLKKPIKPMFFSNLIFSIFLAELNSLYKAYIRQANEELNVQLLLHGNTIQ